MVYPYYAFLGSLCAGALNSLSLIPIPVVTNERLLRNKTQWLFENSWVTFTILGVFLLPALVRDFF